MLDKLKHTFSQTVIYSLGNLTTKMVGLILLPLYVSELTTTDYGVLSLLEVTSQILVAVLGMHLSKAMMRWYAEEKDLSRQKSIVLNTYGSVFIVAVIYVVGFQFFDEGLSVLYFGKADFKVYFSWLSFWVAAEMLNRVTLDLIRIYERTLFFLLITVSKFVAILGLNILFVAYYKMGVEGIILGQVIGNSLVLVLTFPFIYHKIRGASFDKIILSEMMSYSFPLIFSTLSTMILTMSDRFMIKYLASYSEVGVYSLGYKVASVLNVFVIQSFQMGFLPIGYKMFKEKNAPQFFARVMTYLLFVLFFIGLGISLFSKELIVFFAKSNQAYWVAYTVIPLLILSFVFRGANYMVSLGLHYTKNTRFNAYILILAATVNVVLNYITIPIYGIYGASLASVVANAIMLVMFYHFSQKYYPINYELVRLLKVFIVGILLLATGLWVDYSAYESLSSLIVKAILLISFPVLLRLVKFFSATELAAFKGIIRKWKDVSSIRNNFKDLF